MQQELHRSSLVPRGVVVQNPRFQNEKPSWRFGRPEMSAYVHRAGYVVRAYAA
ncbi:hypothetical protein ABIA06_005444 [Bradyrhizobium yuanmingense]|uniref:hypothetical protein n=1 Tax=Bradyrhizobium yuanmingense TaxID=108015 RepID=UPI003511FFE6